MILDGRGIAAASLTGPTNDLRSHLLACHPNAEIPPLDHVVLTAEPMVARVNHGIWIASCSCGAPANKVPTPGCVVFLGSPFGWCVRCNNRAWGGGWRRIVVPPEHERRLIEAVLLCRQNVGDRNWEPVETVELLAAENAAHGDPVPDLDVVRIGPLHGPSLRDLLDTFPPAETMVAVLAPMKRSGRWRRLAGRLARR